MCYARAVPSVIGRALAYEAPFDTVMFFALGQVPMYVLPALLMPLYRRVASSAAESCG